MGIGSLADNPFAALTIVVAPAILTNASSVLCLGTGHRTARVVDRTRAVATGCARLPADSAHRAEHERQLDELRVRSSVLLRALRLFYTSLGSFAAAALFSTFGAMLAVSVGQVWLQGMALLGLITGTVAVTGLVLGCSLIVHDIRVAVRSLAEETRLAKPHETS
jgi:Protein of unknown function (DUF2721)